MSRYKEICGCIHIHYPLKKLNKSFSQLAEDGRVAGVDFLIINSHTPSKKNMPTYENLFEKEGYYGKILIIKSEETNDKDKQNHLLLLGGKKWHGGKESVSQVLSEIENLGYLSFVAHPEGFHKFFLYKKQYRWDDWSLKNFTGIEIWSMLFDWAKFTRIYNLPITYCSLPYNLKGPSSSLLSLWDNLSMKRKIVGIAGLDIHLLPFFFRCIDIGNKFVYSNVFKILRNHIFIEGGLTYNPQEDKKKLMDAFKKGHLFFANDRIHNSKGFYFGSEDRNFIMGDEIKLGEKLLVKNPTKAYTRIIFNGKLLWEKKVESSVFLPEKTGIYRVEAFLNGRPWIFSNHISVIT
jgi:hypothetical protein